MIYCNNCPCFAPPNNEHIIRCGITGYILSGNDKHLYYQDEADCPLDHIKLKDGFVYEPEVQDGEV